MEEKKAPLLRPLPRSRFRGALLILVLALAAVLAAVIYYMPAERSAPLDAGEEEVEAEAVAGAPASRETGAVPSAVELRKVWDLIRNTILPDERDEKAAVERDDLLEDEVLATKAEKVLRRLIELDPKKDRDEIERELTEIRKIGYPAIKPLALMLKTYRNERHLLLLLDALAQVTDADVGEPLEALMASHPSKAVRDKARDLYVDRTRPESRRKFLDEAVDTLASDSPDVSRLEKANMIDYLAASGSPEALDRLKEVSLSDPDEALRRKAIQAIGDMNTAEGEDFLFGLVVEDPSLRRAAADALGKSKSESVAETAMLLIEESGDKSVKLAAVGILGQNGSEKAGDYLLRLMKGSKDNEVKRAAAEAAGQIKTSDMAESLIGLLSTTQDRGQRRAIVSAISKMGPMAAPLLYGAVLKSSGTARADAIRALAQMRTKESFDALKAILEDWRVGGDAEAQNELLVGIKVYGKQDVVPELERVVSKAALESTRRKALETIADIKKADAIPFVLSVYQKDTSESVKRGALRIMSRYGDRDIAIVLRQELLYGEDKKLKSEIEKTIKEIEKEEQ